MLALATQNDPQLADFDVSSSTRRTGVTRSIPSASFSEIG
jgi:hypothetical protein